MAGGRRAGAEWRNALGRSGGKNGHGMGIGRGKVACEGAECAKQAVERVSWRHCGMYLESQEMGVIPGLGGGGQDHAYRYRHGKLCLELDLLS